MSRVSSIDASTVLYQVFFPLTGGYECLVRGASESETATVSTLLAQYNTFVFVWFLFITKGKAKLGNIALMVAVVVASFLVGHFHHGGIDEACWTSLAVQWYVSIGWAVLILLLALMERWLSGGSTAAEEEALLSE